MKYYILLPSPKSCVNNHIDSNKYHVFPFLFPTLILWLSTHMFQIMRPSTSYLKADQPQWSLRSRQWIRMSWELLIYQSSHMLDIVWNIFTSISITFPRDTTIFKFFKFLKCCNFNHFIWWCWTVEQLVNLLKFNFFNKFCDKVTTGTSEFSF